MGRETSEPSDYVYKDQIGIYSEIGTPEGTGEPHLFEWVHEQVNKKEDLVTRTFTP